METSQKEGDDTIAIRQQNIASHTPNKSLDNSVA